MKQISDNEIYLLIKYIKSLLWRAEKRLSYIEDARCLKVNKCVKLVLFCLTTYLLSEAFVTFLPQVPLSNEIKNVKTKIPRCKEIMCPVFRPTAHRWLASRNNVISIFINKPPVFHTSCTKKF